MSKGFEPAVKLPVIQPSREEQLATLALCEKYGWDIPADLQQLKNARDVAAAAGFQRPPVGTVEQRAAKIKADAALMFESKIEPTKVPDFVARKNAEETSRLESQIAELRERSEHS
jgi:hypothetical protein